MGWGHHRPRILKKSGLIPPGTVCRCRQGSLAGSRPHEAGVAADDLRHVASVSCGVTSGNQNSRSANAGSVVALHHGLNVRVYRASDPYAGTVRQERSGRVDHRLGVNYGKHSMVWGRQRPLNLLFRRYRRK